MIDQETYRDRYSIPPCAVLFNRPEEVRVALGLTQAKFAAMLDMPVRTYEDKLVRGFRTVDLYAAKFLYERETDQNAVW